MQVGVFVTGKIYPSDACGAGARAGCAAVSRLGLPARVAQIRGVPRSFRTLPWKHARRVQVKTPYITKSVPSVGRTIDHTPLYLLLLQKFK